MSLDAALSIASSGLAAVNRQLTVVGQNVANAGTAGYVKETLENTAVTAGGLGFGVRSGVATRVVDQALQDALGVQDAEVARATTLHTALSAVGTVQGSTAAGTDLASRLGALADSFTALSGDPSNQTAQRAVVSAAGVLAAGIAAQSAAYNTGRQTAQDGVVSAIGQLNTALRAVGKLSDQIIGARAAGLSTADLESQRDAQEQAATRLAGFRFLAQDNGDVLAVSGGLVADTRAATGPFAVASATLGAGSSAPAVTLGGADVTGQLNTGSIGASLALRDTILPTSQAGLDEFAHTLATRFDNQGLRLFTDPAGTMPTTGGGSMQSGYVGFSQTVTVNPAVVTTPSLVRDGTQPVAAGANGATAFTPNPSGGPSGFGTLISRVLSYTLGSQVQDGTAQPVPATAGLGSAGTLSLSYTAGTTLASFAANLVAAGASATADASDAVDAASALQTTLDAKLQSTSGVSVDTEMAHMIALQNAYGANAKVISASQAMWTALLNAVNG